MKAIFSIESHVVTPNIQFKKATKRMVGIEKGRLIPMRKETFFEAHDVVIGINNFEFEGSDGH
jgi:hypothetical protein